MRPLAVMALAGALLSAPAWPASPTAAATRRAPALTVMTRNLDEGTDFGPLVGAKTTGAFLSAAATAWAEVQASNIPQRAAAVAAEIAADRPDLVSIEEASIWRTGPLLKPPATTVVYDALASLQQALAADHAPYRVAVVENELDLEGPTALGYDVRVSDQDAILARTGLHLSHATGGHFATVLTLTPVGVKERILRGWTSVDVTVGGRTVRYVETHLESFSNPIQLAQAKELLAGPAHGALPVIVACDCNTGPGVTPTYHYLVTKGHLRDVWSTLHPHLAGYTWPLHGEDPYVPVTTPHERIDLVLIHGALRPTSIRLVGNTRSSLTSAGLWPSDHAGVLATISVR